MLFAVDIDGTIATSVGTDGYGRYVEEKLGVMISPDWKMEPGISYVDQLLQEEAVRCWVEQRGNLKEFSDIVSEGQYSAIVQERSLPIAGAAEALRMLVAQHHRIIYITNRKSTTRHVTSDWLARSGFPSPQALCCCGDEQGFLSKVRYAVADLQEGESVIFIDDLARYYEPTFLRLLKEDRAYLLSFIHRCAVIRFGSQTLPHCFYKYPVFPMAPLPTWSHLSETLAATSPYIGAEATILAQFFDETFVPALLRRTRNPRILQATSTSSQGVAHVQEATSSPA